MSENAQPKRQTNKVEVQARIWRAIDKEAIAHRGDPVRQQAERMARKELRRVIDDAHAGQP
jgi:hypothetical protein